MYIGKIPCPCRSFFITGCLVVFFACGRHPSIYLTCGDGIAQANEECDGDDLKGATCWTRGYFLGLLRCTNTCTYDEGDCRELPTPECGNGLREAGEYCDGEDLGSATCESLGYPGGTLSCVECTFDTSGCEGERAICGNGLREAGEYCDGEDIGSATCESLGYDAGHLARSMNCTYDFSGCSDPCAWTHDGAQGCAFVAVSMANPQLMMPYHNDFGILVANQQAQEARVRVQGPNVYEERLVPALGSDVFLLPTLDFLRTAGSTVTFSHFQSGLYRAAQGQGAYFITSDRPVRAAQFNPFHHLLGANQGFTADASLLLPIRDLGNRTVIMSRSNWFLETVSGQFFNYHCNYPGNIVVVAVEDDTSVTVVPRAKLAEGHGVVATPAGVPLTRRLDRGDVLQLMTESDFLDCPDGPGAASIVINGDTYCTGGLALDLTGSTVISDRPVAVWAGHNLAFIPYDLWAGDLLEEVMPPKNTLGTHHLVALTELPVANTAANFVRVLAVEDRTRVEFSPPVHASVTLDAGEFFELPVWGRLHLEVSSSAPVLVGKFVLAAKYFGTTYGDPSFGIVVPTHRFRAAYRLALPSNFQYNTLQIVAPLPASPDQRIWLDDQPFEPSAYTPIGDSGWGVIVHEYSWAHHPRSAHFYSRDPKITFSVELFGYATYQSYLLPTDW